jgi:integrase
VARNVTEAVDKPKASHRRPEPLDAAQARRLLKAAHGHRLYALFVLALATGMRQGELLALRWVDVDLSKGTVRVERTLQPARNSPAAFDVAKTERSRRVVDVGPSVAATLREHKVR